MYVLKIGAAWCMGCIVMRPRWEKIEDALPWLETRYLDYDDDQDEIKSLGIATENLPTFIFYSKQGEELERKTGEISKDELLQTIERLKNS
ncbi:thioredoxin family protein [candidate division WWE3 bacterium]|uniref:Thioredoxin family protein n=1 Tax=candidate division WWE3 bacterium TaxID=2053526 RepID=A0A955LK51_UNCKA|nr:thioredoxin family protein [candidate division WWE3 bacterium]